MKKALSNSISMSLALTFPTFTLRAAPYYQRLAKRDGLSLKPLPKSVNLGKGGALHAIGWTLFSNKRFKLDFSPLSQKLFLLEGKAKIWGSSSLGFHIANHLQKEIWLTLPKLMGFQSTFHLSSNAWALKVAFRETGLDISKLLGYNMTGTGDDVVSRKEADEASEREGAENADADDKPKSPATARPNSQALTQKDSESALQSNDNSELFEFFFGENPEKSALESLKAAEKVAQDKAMASNFRNLFLKTANTRLYSFGTKIFSSMHTLAELGIGYGGAYPSKESEEISKTRALLHLIQPKIAKKLYELEQSDQHTELANQLERWFQESCKTILQFENLESPNSEALYENTYPSTCRSRLQKSLDFFIISFFSDPIKNGLFEQLKNSLQEGNRQKTEAYFASLSFQLREAAGRLNSGKFDAYNSFMDNELRIRQQTVTTQFSYLCELKNLKIERGISYFQKAALESAKELKSLTSLDKNKFYLEAVEQKFEAQALNPPQALKNIQAEVARLKAEIANLSNMQSLPESSQSALPAGENFQKKSSPKSLDNVPSNPPHQS